MHEMGLAEGILAVVLDVGEGQPVRRVQLRVGRLQRVVPDSLQFSFQLLAEETPAAQALLEIVDVPARWRCSRCATESDFAAPPVLCAYCGASEGKIVAGDEILVDAVELDDGWRRRPGAEDIPLGTVAVSAEHLRKHALAEAAGLAHEEAAASPAH
ncbi:MAG: hydrogenase maturation nickel metallochaperone HypA [Chloroflexota bacterium]